MEIILTVIIGLLVLTVLVVAHESGHFFVGRACGIRIEEFAVGFGPKLFSKVKNGIRYSIRALPLGGFVQFFGEDSDEGNEPRAFHNRPIWQRFLTLLAGPMMNIIFAVILAAITLTAFGDYTPIVREPMGQEAYDAGIREGDRIIGVNGSRIDFSMEFAVAYQQKGEDSVLLTVERDGEELTLTMPYATDAEGNRLLPFSYASERKTFGFFEALGLSFKWMYLILAQMLSALGELIFHGVGAQDVAGPVGTIALIGDTIRSGPEMLIRLAALLSVNLGIMNLLPFPALDGGRIVLLGIEKIRRKPLPREKEGYINFAGLIILFGLMILLTYQDISRLISGG